MATSDKIVVIEREDGVGRIEELRMEDNLDSIRRMVEKLHATDLVQHRILMVVEHVMGNNWRKSVALHGEETATKQDSVLSRDKLLLIGQWVTLVPLEGAFKDAATNTLLDNVCSISQGLDNRLTLECLNSERSGLSRHDDESHHCQLATSSLETVVESCQRLDEHVNTLIPELITTGSEEVQCVVDVEIEVTVEMTSNKIVNLLLCLLVQVLELVNGRELGDIETIGKNTIRLSLQQMFGLERLSVVNTTLACLSINIEPLEVVVEVHGAGAEVSAEKSGVCGEDRRDIDAAPLAKGKSDTSKPLVEVSNNGFLLFVAHELNEIKEPGNKVTKNNGLVGLIIARWRRNTGRFPQVGLPLI
ncbi:hypothetical protein HG530_003460 [Fusarium avenaceum]|nr:hypothetical protein HG530_003460 [Fusarium avenaceum]